MAILSNGHSTAETTVTLLGIAVGRIVPTLPGKEPAVRIPQNNFVCYMGSQKEICYSVGASACRRVLSERTETA